MTERVKGLSLEEAGKIKNTEIANELCLPPVKLHCSSEFLTYFINRGRHANAWVFVSARGGCYPDSGYPGLSKKTYHHD